MFLHRMVTLVLGIEIFRVVLKQDRSFTRVGIRSLLLLPILLAAVAYELLH